jgi:hypothetical protein
LNVWFHIIFYSLFFSLENYLFEFTSALSSIGFSFVFSNKILDRDITEHDTRIFARKTKSLNGGKSRKYCQNMKRANIYGSPITSMVLDKF